MMLKRVARICLCGLFVFGGTVHAAESSWPVKPVTIVIPFAIGGVSDVTTRMLAAKLRSEFGQSFLAENRAGAGGNIGADYVAKANPDGYTLFQGTSAHVTNMSLYKTLPYDFIRDFAPVSQISFVPSVLVVHPSLPVKNLGEFIKFVRNPKNVLHYGSGGSGSVTHLAPAVFDKLVGSRMTHVPYKGNGPALTDLMGGQIEVVFSPFIDAITFIKAGKLRALGMTTKTRSALLPDLQAIAELVPGYEVVLWNGIFAPAKTPPEIVNRLSEAIARIIKQPDTRKFLADHGSEPVSSTPAQFREFIASEVPKWRTLVEVSGARVE